MSIEPFDTLLELEKQCKNHARPLPLQRDMSQGWQGLGFLLGKDYFVAPLGEIKEVIPVPKLTSLPASAEWFMGLANLRGRVLPVTDLQKFIVGVDQPLTALSRVMVIDFEQSKVGFLVSQVLGVQRFLEQPKAVQTKEDKVQDALKPYLQGFFNNTKHRWAVLSFSQLTGASHFYHVVKELGAK